MNPGDITANKGDSFICKTCKKIALIAARDIRFCSPIVSEDWTYPDGTKMPYKAKLHCIECSTPYNNINTVDRVLNAICPKPLSNF